MAAILDAAPIAWVPSGTLEWHCHHLPLGLDGVLAEKLCERAARQSGGVVVPPTYWAIGGVPFPYTTRIEPEIVERLFVSILEQLGQIGCRGAVVLACHYGIDHYTALKRAALHVMHRSSLTVWALPEFELTVDMGFHGGDHAGAWETSLMLALLPDMVHADRLPAEGPLLGVTGEDPRIGASAERGQTLAAVIVDRLAELGRRTCHAISPEARSAHLDVLALQVRLLELVRRDRATMPRSQARSLVNEPYLYCLDQFWRGNYQQARDAAERAYELLVHHSTRNP